jgi:hypothetical protein
MEPAGLADAKTTSATTAKELSVVIQTAAARQRRSALTFGALMVLILGAAAVLILGTTYLEREVASVTAAKATAQADLRNVNDALAKAQAELNQKQADLASSERDLAALKGQIDTTKAELILKSDQLSTQVKQFEKERATVQTSVAALAKAAPAAAAITERLPFATVAVPHARAERLPEPAKGPAAGKEPTYRFYLSLSVPQARRDQIAKVVYTFDHPTFKHKDMTSTDPSNNFEVNYVGWGALTNVTITITTRDGKTEQMPFNMVHALDWR